MATPTAYKLTSKPAEGRLTPKSFAIVGTNPTITNSVVPIANALKVSAHKANGIIKSSLLVKTYSLTKNVFAKNSISDKILL
ncbi:hypothetical protein PAT01_06810 [Pseudoalteromonas atlantica]|uniref:Uncharacterized protein n=1 Tax=Pseudoalteromonas atlantica TaxID=288 RepID=A0ABQ0UAB5_PSEAF|nr:hypothetical protein PAT01_06810 [Pseudoalteromonas atlantica]